MHKIISILLLLISTQLNAQDTLRVDRISLGGNFNSGNSESFQILAKSSVSYQGANSKHGLIFSPDYFLLYTGNTGEFIKKSEDFRVDLFGWRDLKNNYSIIAFSDLEHSYSKKIDLRVAGGVGIKKLVKYKSFKSGTSIAPLYDEMFIGGKQYGSARISLRQSISFSVFGININSMLLYQPAIWSSSDFRMRDNTNSSLMMEVSKKISSNLSLGIQYDSWFSALPARINPKVQELDQRIGFSIIYKR